MKLIIECRENEQLFFRIDDDPTPYEFDNLVDELVRLVRSSTRVEELLMYAKMLSWMQVRP